MRSMQRLIALTLGLLAVGAPGVSIAAWKFQDNGPRFTARDERSSTVLKDELVSLAPKTSVAELRSFRRFSGHGPAPHGLAGPKPSLDRYWANTSRRPSERSSSIAVDTD